MFHYDWLERMCDDWIICWYVTIFVEMKPEYWGCKKIKVPWLYMYLYVLVRLNWYDMWWLNYMFLCNHFGWNETRVLRIKRKSRYHSYICIYVLQYGWNEMTCVCLNDEYICNSYDWNKIRVMRIEKKSRYWGLHMNLCAFEITEMKSVWEKWSMYDWN